MERQEISRWRVAVGEIQGIAVGNALQIATGLDSFRTEDSQVVEFSRLPDSAVVFPIKKAKEVKSRGWEKRAERRASRERR